MAFQKERRNCTLKWIIYLNLPREKKEEITQWMVFTNRAYDEIKWDAGDYFAGSQQILHEIYIIWYIIELCAGFSRNISLLFSLRSSLSAHFGVFKLLPSRKSFNGRITALV